MGDSVLSQTDILFLTDIVRSFRSSTDNLKTLAPRGAVMGTYFGGQIAIVVVIAQWHVWLFTPKGFDSTSKLCTVSMEFVSPRSIIERFLLTIS